MDAIDDCWYRIWQAKKRTYDDINCLYVIVSAGHLEVVKLLLQKGADPSLENETKQSVL